jgi:hypothetical protein
MISCLVAATLFFQQSPSKLNPPSLDASITASLVNDGTGHWSVRLVGPANPPNWVALPEQLQLSLVSVGDEPGGGHPTLTFQKPDEGAQAAFVKEAADSEASLPISLSSDSTSPTFVKLRASGFALCTDAATQKVISLPVVGSDDLIYIPTSIDAPQVAPGQRFFYLPTRELPLKGAEGKTVPFSKGALHELRLESIDKHDDGSFQMHLRLEGWPDPVTLDGTGDALAIDGMPAILYDEALRGLRTRFLNKPTWVYGGCLMSVAEYPDEWASVRIGSDKPIIPKKILRLYTHHVMLNVGPQIAALGGVTNSSFFSDCPIYVIADIGSRGQITAAMGSSSDDMSKMMKRKVALTGCQIVADPWHFERTFSLKSGLDQHSDWDPSQLLVQSIYAGKIRVGMTHAMVAWTLGWPGEPSSKKSLMSWPKWRYDIVAPYSFWVQFSGDKVVSFGEDGNPGRR